MNYGTVTWNLFKANMNALPSDTIVVDLCRTEEQILASMKPKTRYNIGLARRKGVEVREMGPEALSLWYDLYSQTAHGNGLHVNDMRYFESVFASRMQCPDPEVSVKLLMAFHEEKPLAAMFLILSAHRVTYLYGASATEGRHLMPRMRSSGAPCRPSGARTAASTTSSASRPMRIPRIRYTASTLPLQDGLWRPDVPPDGLLGLPARHGRLQAVRGARDEHARLLRLIVSDRNKNGGSASESAVIFSSRVRARLNARGDVHAHARARVSGRAHEHVRACRRASRG